MKFSIPTRELLAVTRRLVPHVQKSNVTRPILQHIAVEADADGVRLSATDRGSEVSITTSVDPEAHGGATIPAQMLVKIARSLPLASHVEVSHKGSTAPVVMRSGKHTAYELTPFDVNDFPRFETAGFGEPYRLPTKDLRELFLRTAYAMSTDESRRYLCGVFLTGDERGDGTLVAVGLDGYQMSVVEKTIETGCVDFPGTIVPPKMVKELSLPVMDDGEMAISFHEEDDRLVRFRSKTLSCVTRTVDGVFPAFRRLLPTKTDTSVKFKSKEMLTALAQATVIAKIKDCPVQFDVTPDRIGVCVNSRGFKGTSSLAAEATGEVPKVSFSNKYLGNLLAQYKTKTMEMVMRKNEGAAIFKPVGDSSAQHLIMPIRT